MQLLMLAAADRVADGCGAVEEKHLCDELLDCCL